MNQTALTKGLPSYIRAGEVLGGKYRLERELGRGAMGTVWSAVHLSLGQRVAIKLISAEHAQSAEARQRFSVEAKAAAKLRSRHVVQVYDDGETPAGTPYIVLEYLEGETLEERLERERELPLQDAARIVGHVGRALSRAHAQGIVHRDLKPGNIFLSRTDEDEVGWVAKVLDFGIAKLDDQRDKGTTKAGTLLGTPLFMSPEQVRGASSVDHRADLYSLGIVFYNMVTGRFAFNGESFGDVLLMICTEPLPSIRAHAPWLPAAIESWFQRACARDPKDRFQSADEMVEALKLAVGDSLGLNSVSVSRQSSPEELNLDTLRGHSPPVPHQMPRNESPIDTGPRSLAKTQVAVTDPTLASGAPAVGVRAGSESGTASLTVHEAGAIPKRPTWPLFVALGVAGLTVIGLAALKLFAGGSAEQAAAGDPRPEATQVVAAPNTPPPSALPSAAPAEPVSPPAPPVESAAQPPPAPPEAKPAASADVAPPPRKPTKPVAKAPSKKDTKASKPSGASGGSVDIGF